MKRILFSLMVVLMVSALVVPVALAAPAYSSVQVLNLGTADASINIYYYNQDGSAATMSGGNPNPVPDTVLVGQSNTYFPVHTADGFNGSVVIESTEPIAVISNILYTSTPMQQSSWNGFEAGGTTLRFPLIMKGNNSSDTTFNVQNTTSAPVSILIQFVPEPGAGYGSITDVTDTIPAWAAHTYDQRSMAQFSAVTKWVGSAKVTVQGEGAIAGVAQILDSLRSTAGAYNGFLAGSATVEAPLITTANAGIWTAINCQNLGATNTDMTANYIPESGYPAKAAEPKPAVLPNGTAVWLNYGTTKWVGAAQITNTAGNDMACVVNQLNLTNFYFSSYEGFNAALATNTSVTPMIQFQPQADGKALWTSINVKNLSGSNATISVDYKPGPGFADVTTATKPAVAGAVAVFLFYDPYGNGTKFLGGAEVSSDAGQDLAVVVNQQKINYTGDFFSSYDGFPK